MRDTVGVRAGQLWASGRRAWRLSLQLRMVTITLLVSGLLVGTFGFLVAKLITDGQLTARQQEARAQVDKGANYAATQLVAVTQRNDPAYDSTATQVLTSLASRPEQGAGDEVTVALLSDVPTAPVRTWPEDVRVSAAISSQLRDTVRRGLVAHQHRTVDIGGGTKTYLVYGAPVPTGWGGEAELYYFFPLDRQVEQASKVTGIVMATGTALVLLLAVVAALVTQLVVRPVRLAARTAQRLSAGLLDQRMEVRGEDDLAALAAAFNQMAANLQRQIMRLEEMSRLQRRFTSDVSHELRTPLTTVRMAADLIFSERDAFDPAVARSAELLQLELNRFEGLLSDLLEISRFDAGFAALDAEPTDVAAIVRRVADRLGALAAVAGVEIELDLPAEPVIAELDARRVERVLRNLVGNAVEHAERRPVRVTLAADEAAVALTVRDHGIGLYAGEEKLVFNRFWRSDPSRARQTGGTGLGLSISLEDARLHGGWLEAWGAPGRGAQFRLTLPARAGHRLVSSPLRLVPADAYLDPAPAATVPPARTEPAGHGRRIPARRAAEKVDG
ncbi:MAG TPA: MtrAB system histidine kinase MtrB [Micromonosporaceae bacterium]|nr:MtrAB system histidine kinase MtrB [Micromonosporaceae bacterium]